MRKFVLDALNHFNNLSIIEETADMNSNFEISVKKILIEFGKYLDSNKICIRIPQLDN